MSSVEGSLVYFSIEGRTHAQLLFTEVNVLLLFNKIKSINYDLYLDLTSLHMTMHNNL